MLHTVPTYTTHVDTPLVTNPNPTQRFLGINAAVDHKSETQLQTWKDRVGRLYTTYNASPLGLEEPLDYREFFQRTTGMNTDHAPDQHKAVRLNAASYGIRNLLTNRRCVERKPLQLHPSRS